MTCPQCDGDGYVWACAEYDIECDPDGCDVRCRMCQGTGELPPA